MYSFFLILSGFIDVSALSVNCKVEGGGCRRRGRWTEADSNPNVLG